ncbi:transporter [Dactylosporangium sp. NBC_01737]|uniref:transporter n=1 Tax=Dactylosporangium sp. NBC_01737 TaxID=2975959 RepID=UPI002E162E75|nr:transporter [Dactylosporangium sp. NBC_01737]
MTPVDDDAPPASPAESLALIQQEQAAVTSRVGLNPLAYYLPWGVAWLVGYGLLFLRYGPDGRIFVGLPDWLPLVVLFVCMALAMVSTVGVSVRRGRGVEGRSSWQGTAYGLSWFLAFAGVGSTLGRFAPLLPDQERGLLWASVSVGTVAVMYMAGSAIWLSRDMFVLGAWLTVINIAGVALGPGWHSLLVSLGGGGGLCLLGVLLWLRGRRSAQPDGRRRG